MNKIYKIASRIFEDKFNLVKIRLIQFLVNEKFKFNIN